MTHCAFCEVEERVRAWIEYREPGRARDCTWYLDQAGHVWPLCSFHAACAFALGLRPFPIRSTEGQELKERAEIQPPIKSHLRAALRAVIRRLPKGFSRRAD